MSALYAIRYVGGADSGMGALYIGRGRVLGVDVGNGRYTGSYTEQDGRIRGTITLTAKSAVQLVVGMTLPPGQSIQITIDWPSNFADGQVRQVTVMGRPVQVAVEKVGDIP